MPPAVHPFVRLLFIVSQSVSQYSTAPLTHSLTQWCYCSFRLWRYVNTTFLFMYGRLRCAWDVGMQKFYVKFSIQSSNNSNTNQTNNIRLATKTNLLALLSDIHTPTRQPTRSSRERAKAATTSDDDDVYTHARVFNAAEVMNERTNEWMKSCHKCKTHIFIDLLEQHYLLRCR